MKQAAPPAFSKELQTWLRGKNPKTLASLIELSENKSFAVIMLFLMLLPALPIPTGGITHVFEVITILLAFELVLGLQTVWLPERAKRISLAKFTKGKAAAQIIKRVSWLEKHSSPRGRWILQRKTSLRFIGLLIIGITLSALLAPPFSGLDTIPSIAVVLISLAIILEDAVLLMIGSLLGIAGAVATFFLAKEVTHFIHNLI